MFMFVRPDAASGSYPVYGGPSASAQYGLQILLVVIAFICVPWMLLAKPIVLYFRYNKKNYSRVSYFN